MVEVCMGVQALHRVQKWLSDPLELQALTAAQHECWELNLGPVQDVCTCCLWRAEEAIGALTTGDTDGLEVHTVLSCTPNL